MPVDRRREVTIDDVAAVAGVSVATVSRALRNLPNVAPSTRERVVGVARTLSYRPDPNASRLAAGRSHAVAIAVPLIGQWYYSQVISGAEAVVSGAGSDLFVVSADSPTQRRRFVDEAIAVQRRVDGLIMVDLMVPEDEAAQWRRRGVRLVTVGQPTASFPSIGIDDRAAAAQAVEHLIELGHREIGLIGGASGDPFELTVPIERRAAYLDTLRAHGIAPRPELQVEGNFSIEGGMEAMERLLALTPRPSAVFAMSDEMAMGALSRARSAGLDVPGDVSVVGFDDHDLAQVVDLTTVRQRPVAIGATAARLLAAETSNGQEPARMLAPTWLIVRSTTGPPAGA